MHWVGRFDMRCRLGLVMVFAESFISLFIVIDLPEWPSSQYSNKTRSTAVLSDTRTSISVIVPMENGSRMLPPSLSFDGTGALRFYTI